MSLVSTILEPLAADCRLKLLCVVPEIFTTDTSNVPVFSNPPLIVVISVLEALASSLFKLVKVTRPSNCVEANGAEKVIVCDPPKLDSVIV